jgi:hypothetical protein
MDSSEHDKPLIIGKDIPWKTIEQYTCRVKHFAPYGEIREGKIVPPTLPLPYAMLSVELPELRNKFPTEVSMPVAHKEDFRNLWVVFQERGVKAEEEVLVSYAPFSKSRLLRIISSFMPCLHIYIFPRGHSDESSTPNFRPENWSTWSTPIAAWHPKGWQL